MNCNVFLFHEVHIYFQLMQAMALYSLQARGPASGQYAEKLATECTSYWKSGRQMCEELSLTG